MDRKPQSVSQNLVPLPEDMQRDVWMDTAASQSEGEQTRKLNSLEKLVNVPELTAKFAREDKALAAKMNAEENRKKALPPPSFPRP
ncbi:MAG: hypothetical protein ACRD1I_08240 [Terriglobia bacterium]